MKNSKLKILALASIVFLISFSGCSTTQTITAEGVVVTTVDTGMKGWAAYVASGKATQAEVDHVHTAYDAYYTAQLAAEAALETLVTSGSTNTVAVTTANTAVLAAETQLLSLLNQYLTQ